MPPKAGGSGSRFLLRLPTALHRVLQSAAAAAGLSLNEYCVRRLAASGAGLAGDEHAARVVARAAQITPGKLVGVIVHGSWIRREARAGSDVDVLIVIDRSVPLTRALYAAWDAVPMTWRGAPVDVHFSHLADEGPPPGLWGEVALDGVVIFERDHDVTARLIAVRRDIASGRLVRRVVHGQPYWTVAA